MSFACKVLYGRPRGRLGNRPDSEVGNLYTSSALQLVKSFITLITYITFITFVALVALVTFVALVSHVAAKNHLYSVILSTLSLCHSER